MRDLSRFKYHPRVLEVRFMVVYDRCCQALGDDRTTALFDFICEQNGIKAAAIRTFIGDIPSMESESSHSVLLYQQEKVFAGTLWGDSRADIAKKDLGVTVAYVYQQKIKFNPEHFVTERWVERLGNRATTARIGSLYDELNRFMQIIQTYLSIL